MDAIDKILAKISTFEPEDGEWLQLDKYLNELWATGKPDRGKVIILNVFERYPQEDGDGVFWSIVHGLESLGDYEKELVASLQRQPSEMGIIMLKRLQNSGKLVVAGQEINLIYQNMIDHPKAPESVKSTALKYKK